jgi:hypothetical protein
MDKFPFPDSKQRLADYDRNMNLLKGDHYAAFGSIAGAEFSERYKMLRYVVCNYAGLISKVIADILMGEGIVIKAEKNQEWLDNLYFSSKLQVQLYESALKSSARGDAVLRIRVQDKELFIEDVNPAIYFPELDKDNYRAVPKSHRFAWTNEIDGSTYVIVETYVDGFVKTNAYEVEKDEKISREVGLEEYNLRAGTNYEAEVKTGITKPLVVHIPNWRNDDCYFGVSDYADLVSLMYALNSRMTKIDNTLDKHQDPILAVPDGVLDDNGKVRKEAFQMFEMDASGNKPEYITWNASLDSAYKQIDKLMEFLFMFSETAPDALGMGQGQSDSGRALKLKLLRTIAKKNRKKLYYDQGIKEILVIAQELAIANGYTVNGMKLTGEPETPQLIWSDGVVDDYTELIQNEAAKLEIGLTSKVRAIMNIDGISEEQAKAVVEEVNAETPNALPSIPFAGASS